MLSRMSSPCHATAIHSSIPRRCLSLQVSFLLCNCHPLIHFMQVFIIAGIILACVILFTCLLICNSTRTCCSLLYTPFTVNKRYDISLSNIMSGTTKSKRKRTTQFEVLSSRPSTPGPSLAPAARNVTFTSDGHGSRIRESSDVSDINISLEDLAILQEHPEFSSTADNFLDFETAVCDALDPNNSSTTQPSEEPQEKQRVCT